MDHWIAAQNAGDFATYNALYARRFEGVKRIGARSRSFDRDGWMRDRQRMFGKPIHVEAVNAVINVFRQMAFVRFEQRWSSGTFADVGTKELQLIREAGELRISVERMWTSKVTSSTGKVNLGLSDFMQVEQTKHQYVVLSENADEAWSDGAIGLDADEEHSLYAARRLARVEALPKELISALPVEIVLFGRAGPVCRARSGKLFLLRRFVQPVGMRDEDGPRASDGELAKLVWNGDHRTLLVAEVIAAGVDCSHALWARAASRPAPTIFVPHGAPPDLEDRVKKSVHALRGYKENKAGYALAVKQRREHGDKGPVAVQWEDFDGTQPEIDTWQHGDRVLVSYSISVGGCGDFGGAVWALFEVRGAGLELLAESGRSTLTEEFRFNGVFDLDLDGRVEVFGGQRATYDDDQESVVRSGPSGLTFITEVGTAFHGCGC